MHSLKPKVILDDKQIKKLLKIKDVISVVEDGFRKKGLSLVDLPPKIGPKLFTPGAFSDSMTVSVKSKKGNLEIYGIKWLSSLPDNCKKGLPVLNSTVILNDPKTGLPKAILSGNWITAIRTGAVSAVSAKYLAPKKKKLIIGIFGLGLQAYVHVLAFKSVFGSKNIQFILFNHGDVFLKEFLKKFPAQKFYTSKSVSEVVKNADIILSVTAFPKKISPYIFHRDLKDDVLILPVDYGTRIDPKLYKHLDEVYTDDIAQYELKSKLRQYFPNTSPKIKKEIGDVVAKKYKRKNVQKKILAFNLGIALFDILTTELCLKKLRS